MEYLIPIIIMLKGIKQDDSVISASLLVGSVDIKYKKIIVKEVIIPPLVSTEDLFNFICKVYNHNQHTHT
jgi:hypothetical protein